MPGVRMRFESGSELGTGRRIFLTLFFLAFFSIGCLFTWLVVGGAIETVKTWSWEETECRILNSGVREPDQSNDFEFHVEYTYTVQGRTFTSTRYELKPTRSSDYGEMLRLEQRYPTGTRAVCYVNPADPGQAVLHRGSFWILLIPLFPLLFVAIGAGGIYFIWRGKRKTLANQALSTRPRQNAGVLIGFFLVFLLAGLGFFYVMFLRPVFKIVSARNWTKVPCTVVSSEVGSHHDSDGTTYSVSILYRYEIDGREYKANRYDFMGGSSSGRAGKEEIVRRHPPGHRTFCYVNPSDPTDAVLKPGFTPTMWFGLFPLVFVAVGAGGTVYALRERRKGAAMRTATVPGLPMALGPPESSGTGGVVLKPETGSMTRFLILVGVALFWNGIVSVFLTQVVQSWRRGDPEWFLTLFMVPFVVVGLGFIGGCGYSFLALSKLFRNVPVSTQEKMSP
ncbi:MAG TPA: DUF3592 domain-containing protein, partial [Verrucomicrobiota bacterium]|nr:DUF3592 domain-containing protein [Verrucomicrobiota bacterium]